MITQASPIITGPAGSLETRLTLPETPHHALVILCHPHPQHGGTMNNKVVTTTSKAFLALGLATLCFNYRGVGQSEGEYDHQIGEIDDGLAVYDWVRNTMPNTAIWLAGFSFGAFIAASIANQQPAEQLLTIAPVLTHSDYTALTQVSCPWYTVVGDQDDFISPAALIAWQQQHQPTMALSVVERSSHFFHGQLITLRDTLINHYSDAAKTKKSST